MELEPTTVADRVSNRQFGGKTHSTDWRSSGRQTARRCCRFRCGSCYAHVTRSWLDADPECGSRLGSRCTLDLQSAFQTFAGSRGEGSADLYRRVYETPRVVTTSRRSSARFMTPRPAAAAPAAPAAAAAAAADGIPIQPLRRRLQSHHRSSDRSRGLPCSWRSCRAARTRSTSLAPAGRQAGRSHLQAGLCSMARRWASAATTAGAASTW